MKHLLAKKIGRCADSLTFNSECVEGKKRAGTSNPVKNVFLKVVLISFFPLVLIDGVHKFISLFTLSQIKFKFILYNNAMLEGKRY